jgi:hypothetical protein
MYNHIGCLVLKNIFLRIVGSDNIMLINIEHKINEKLTENACDLVVIKVEKKQAIEIYADVIKK